MTRRISTWQSSVAAGRLTWPCQTALMVERGVDPVRVITVTVVMSRPAVLDPLCESDFIIHVDDIGHFEIIEQLSRVAPVTAVRGNNERGAWASELQETEVLNVGEVFIYVVHDLSQLDIDPVAAGFHAVVSGHSHQPKISERNGVLYVNPGSAGPRRFSLPVSVGHLAISGTNIRPRLVTLGAQSAA